MKKKTPGINLESKDGTGASLNSARSTVQAPFRSNHYIRARLEAAMLSHTLDARFEMQVRYKRDLVGMKIYDSEPNIGTRKENNGYL